jgi:hypothetical protein
MIPYLGDKDVSDTPSHVLSDERSAMAIGPVQLLPRLPVFLA